MESSLARGRMRTERVPAEGERNSGYILPAPISFLPGIPSKIPSRLRKKIKGKLIVLLSEIVCTFNPAVFNPGEKNP